MFFFGSAAPRPLVWGLFSSVFGRSPFFVFYGDFGSAAAPQPFVLFCFCFPLFFGQSPFFGLLRFL
jgi:hypothetical protein